MYAQRLSEGLRLSRCPGRAAVWLRICFPRMPRTVIPLNGSGGICARKLPEIIDVRVWDNWSTSSLTGSKGENDSVLTIPSTPSSPQDANTLTHQDTFPCACSYLDTFQLLKIDGDWKIVNKFFVDQ